MYLEAPDIISKNLHKQTAANSLTALSGGGQSGKNGLTTYFANVSAIIACNQNQRNENYIH